MAVVIGTSGSDFVHRVGDGLVAPPGYNDTPFSTTGNDLIEGLGGNDIIYGDAGDDFLDGGPGADVLNGGPGFNYADYGDATAGVTANLVDPTQNTGDAAGDSYTLIQGLVGSNFDDTLIGDSNSNNIRGKDGNDFIQGGGGADTIDGGTGFNVASWLDQTSAATLNLADQTQNAGSALGASVTNIQGFYLTNSDDTFVGNNSSTFVYGFAGNDHLTGSSASDVLDGGAGADTIDGGAGFDYVSYYSQSYATTAGVTVDLKNPGNDTGYASGDVITNSEAYILTANDDMFVGSDTVQNIVYGYQGNDTFVGGFNTNNWFFGGNGNDRMIGGGVSDLFSLGTGANTIVLTDPTPIAGSSVFGFASGLDSFEISRSTFGLAAGYAVTAGTTFVSGTALSTTVAQPTFLYYTDSGLLYFDPDGTGGTSATLLGQLAGHPTLAAADFHLV